MKNNLTVTCFWSHSLLTLAFCLLCSFPFLFSCAELHCQSDFIHHWALPLAKEATNWGERSSRLGVSGPKHSARKQICVFPKMLTYFFKSLWKFLFFVPERERLRAKHTCTVSISHHKNLINPMRLISSIKQPWSAVKIWIFLTWLKIALNVYF